MRGPTIVIAMSLLLACTSSKPRDDNKQAAASQATPTPVAAPSGADAAKPATPEPAKPSEWWCVCYQSEVEGKAQPASACRAEQKQCRALEQRITRGGRGIVPRSLSHSCRKLVGEHPGEIAGGREAWKPSKLAGAWSSEGACLLEGPPDVVAEAAAPDEPDILAWLDDEVIGPLASGMSAAEVVTALGEPASKDEIFEEGATGDWVQTWEYPDRGVSLFMRANSETGPQSIGGLTIKAPCDFATKRGIEIGSTRADVQKAYGDVKDQDRLFDEEGGEPPSEDAEQGSFVAGSIYGGLIFDFEDELVSSIFRGAAAE